MNIHNSIPKVSIIVPIYNAGELLSRCLDSLINQTLKEIEIILVLDCPTDGSDKIAKKYAEEDSRIVIVENSTNLHIGNSRNEGLKVATGQYVGFSDHDDYRELNMYEKLYEKAVKDGANIVLSLPDYFSEQYGITEDTLENSDVSKLQKEILSDLIGFGNFYLSAFFVTVTSNIYKNDFLKKEDINFINTVKKSPEDLLFQIETIKSSNNISYVNELFYHHVKHASNEGTQGAYTGYAKRSKGLEYLYNYLKSNDIFREYKANFYHGVRKQFLNSLIALIAEFKVGEFIAAVKTLHSYSFTKDAFADYPFGQYKNIGNKLLEKFLVNLLK